MNTFARNYEDHDEIYDHVEAMTKALTVSLRSMRSVAITPWSDVAYVFRFMSNTNALSKEVRKYITRDCPSCSKTDRCLRPIVPGLYHIADELDRIAKGMPYWNIGLIPFRLYVQKTADRLTAVAEDTEDIIDAHLAMDEEGGITHQDLLKKYGM